MAHPDSSLAVVRGAGTHVSMGDSPHWGQQKVSARQAHSPPPSPTPCFPQVEVQVGRGVGGRCGGAAVRPRVSAARYPRLSSSHLLAWEQHCLS